MREMREIFFEFFFYDWYNMHTEKPFPNLIKSNRNQIVFTIFLDWFGTANGQFPFAVPNQSRKIVNTIWFRVDLMRIRKGFPVCSLEILANARPALGLRWNCNDVCFMHGRRIMQEPVKLCYHNPFHICIIFRKNFP